MVNLFIIVLLPHTPNPMPTAGRPEGEVNRTSFHYQWLIYLLLSCFRTPPTPCRRQAGLKGRSTALRFIPMVIIVMLPLTPRPHADGRQAWREVNRTSFHYQWLLLSCFPTPPDPMPTAGRPEGEVNRTSGNAIGYYYCLASAHPQTPWITIQLQDFDFDNYCQRN